MDGMVLNRYMFQGDIYITAPNAEYARGLLRKLCEDTGFEGLDLNEARLPGDIAVYPESSLWDGDVPTRELVEEVERDCVVPAYGIGTEIPLRADDV